MKGGEGKGREGWEGKGEKGREGSGCHKHQVGQDLGEQKGSKHYPRIAESRPLYSTSSYYVRTSGTYKSHFIKSAETRIQT